MHDPEPQDRRDVDAGGAQLSRRWSRVLSALAVILLIFGLGVIGNEERAREVQLGTVAVLWVSAIAVYAGADRPMRRGIVSAGVLGWAAEVVGVHTGFPFGSYRYNAVLGPSVLSVPIAMVPAWSLMSAFAVSVACRWSPRWRGPLAAGWLVLVDMVLDPVAFHALGLWTWHGDGAYYGVPLSNFAGWFVVGWLCALCYPSSAHSAAAHGLGTALVLFYTVVAARHGWTLPATAGIVAAVVSAGLWYGKRGR